MTTLINYKALFIAFCMLLISTYSKAQTSTGLPIEVKETFIKSFNSVNSSNFRTLFDDKLKSSNSVSSLNQRFQRVYNQIGLMQSLRLEEASNNSYTYRSMHKMGSMQIVFTLNDIGKLSEFSIDKYLHKNTPILERNVSQLILPFHGEWSVYWGGKTTVQNYHNASPSTRGASDFYVRGENGKSYRQGPNSNEDFYAFGKELIAPTSGKVVFVSEGVKDNIWPAVNRNKAYGNAVMLETPNKEYIVFAHMKENSIRVKEGQMVSQGDVLGFCGNSGLSTEPHLHFQIQNLPDLVSPTGAFVHFEKIKVNGKVKKDYLPVKGDRISN